MSVKYKIRKDEQFGMGKIMIPSEWNEEIREVMRKQKIKALRLSYSMGFTGSDIQFVSTLRDLESLEIYSGEVTDFSSVSALTQLEVIGIQFAKYKEPINFEKLKKLKVALITWDRRMDDELFSIKTLEHLNIINYPFENLEKLHQLSNLKKLLITSRKLSTLKGIDKLKNLEFLDLYNCPYLENLKGSDRCSKLKRIEIEACRHISKERKIIDIA